MEVKIDTKEKFHVITIKAAHLAANMTEELDKCLVSFLKNDVKNVVLNLKDIRTVEPAAAEYLARVQHSFYEQNASFVICCPQPEVEAGFEKLELLEFMNVTPTESEAWDIVQMEEIEREFLE